MSSVSTSSNPGTPMGSKRMGGHQHHGTMEQHMLDGKGTMEQHMLDGKEAMEQHMLDGKGSIEQHMLDGKGTMEQHMLCYREEAGL